MTWKPKKFEDKVHVELGYDLTKSCTLTISMDEVEPDEAADIAEFLHTQILEFVGRVKKPRSKKEPEKAPEPT